MAAENEKAPANAEARMGGDGNPVRSLSWRFPPVPTLTVTPARCRRALIVSRNEKAQRGGWAPSQIKQSVIVVIRITANAD